MLVLAGGQLRALGKHRQAAAAQRAPAAGSRAGEGEKHRREGDAQTWVTEQTAQIKMETRWRSLLLAPQDRNGGWARPKVGSHLPLLGVLNFQGPLSPRESPAGADTGGAEGACRGRDWTRGTHRPKGGPSGPGWRTARGPSGHWEAQQQY